MASSDDQTADFRIQSSGHREIADGIYLIRDCLITPYLEGADDMPYGQLNWYEEGREKHTVYSSYVIKDQYNLVWDTLGNPASTESVLDGLAEILDGESLDYVAISHPEGPHAGNTPRVLERYPDATVIAPERGVQHDLHGLADIENLVLAGDGYTLDLGTHTVEFVEEFFYDHAMTLWMFEHTARALFCVDFLGCEHMDGECLDHAHEIDSAMTTERLQRHPSIAFTWLRLADSILVEEKIDGIIERYDPAMMCPAHGLVWTEGVTACLEEMKTAVTGIIEQEGADGEFGIHTHRALRYSDTSLN